MKVSTLNTIVSIAGIIFFAISLAIILLDKKVGAEENGQQKIKVGDYIDINTNSILALILITACLATAPIVLTFWKPDLTSHISREDLSENYLSMKDLSLIIYGAVVLDNGRFADNISIEVTRIYRNVDPVIINDKTGDQGDFYIEIPQPKPGERYKITWSKIGYKPEKLNFGFAQVAFPISLQKDEVDQ